MTVAEPTAELGLWPRVRAITGWPEPDEDAVRALAQAWRTSGAQFRAAGQFELGGLDGHWPDAAGKAFGERARRTLDTGTRSGGHMGVIADSADRFAAEVTGVKTGIGDLITSNLGLFALAGALPGGVREVVEQLFVEELANMVDKLVAAAASRVAGREIAPPARPPGLLESLSGAVTGAGAAAVNELASLGNAALNNPGLVLSAALGGGLVALSGVGELAGIGLDATVVGAPAGIPLNVVSAAGIATGLTISGVALAAIAEKAAGDDHVTPVETEPGPSTSEQRAERSLQKQIDEHRTKLEAYKADPDASDNKGFLQNAPTPEIRQRIIDGRVRHLEHEIDEFQKQIDKIHGGN